MVRLAAPRNVVTKPPLVVTVRIGDVFWVKAVGMFFPASPAQSLSVVCTRISGSEVATQFRAVSIGRAAVLTHSDCSDCNWVTLLADIQVDGRS